MTSRPRIPSAMPIGQARVLIVDDEPDNRRLLETMLKPEGFAVFSAESGEAALAMVDAAPPDLILLDVLMPGLDGYEVAQKIKADPATKNIPIIMITAMDDRSARMLGLGAGAEDFLSKPVDRAELCMRVRNLLRLKAYGDYHDKHGQMLEAEVSSRTADLVASERLYRSTFDAAPVGIIHIGLDGHWHRVNQRICDLLGYTRQELASEAIQHLVQGANATGEHEAFSQLAAGRRERHVIEEKRYRRKDGGTVCVRVNVSVHRDADGAPLHFISVVEDTTERMALEAQLRQTSKMDAIGGLASGVAHDFNNLLSVVLTYSELLASELKEGDPMRADLEEIRGAGLRAADLTHQLLAFSRQQVLQPKIVDLGVVAGGIEKMLGRLIGEDVELIAATPASLGKILVDPGQMEQVIMNLAVNARDAMPRGGKLTIETSQVMLDEGYAAAHVGVKPGPHVMLAVTDTGVGMNKETQARMFDPFFTTKGVGKGTGLGLATVFGIVRQSGGTIGVASEIGVGTTVKVFFPTIDESATSARAPASGNPTEARTLRGDETILLVEDEDCVRTLARTILRKYGYNVLEAQGGGDALLLSEQHAAPIDLLLTDMVMPRMNGQQLAERLVASRPEMKVLFMSGYTNNISLDDSRTEGAPFAFLRKPIRPELLARKVRETLDSH